ncbi:hypothetical protein KAH94_03065, partial [bacterium]|nr:hypothetical protein [bacterium]
MISSIDTVLVVTYFLAIAAVGYLSSRKESSEDFFIAGKGLGVFANVCSLTATKITASVILTFVALVYLFGISVLWAFVGIAIGYWLFLLFAIRVKKEGDIHNYYTIGDYFKYRYGKNAGRIVSIVIFITIFLNFIIQLIGGAKMLGVLIGFSFWASVLLCAGIILFYLYLGGFRAVVKTDVVQFISVILFLGILGIFLFSNFEYIPSQWEIMKAGPVMIFSLLLIGIIFPFSAPDLWQRALAAKNVESLKKSFVFASIIYVLFGVLLAFIAIIIKIKLPGADPETALIEGFRVLLPPGFFGLGLITLFAAIMSSADSFAFISAEMLLHNVFGIKKSVENLKFGLVAVVVFGVVGALFFKSIVDASYLLLGLFSVVSAVVIMTWVRKKLSKIVVVSGVLVGAGIVLIFTLIKGVAPELVVVGFAGGFVGMGAGKL